MELPITEEEIAVLIHAETENVFSTMLGIAVKPCRLDSLGRAGDEEGGVVALVGFAGDWAGSGSIRCSAKLACSITGKLLMDTFDEVNADVLDAVGEIANMIMGNFRTMQAPSSVRWG